MRGLIVVTVMLGFVGIAGVSVRAVRGAGPAAQEKAVSVYQCPMHPDVQATWQAKCPICGMTMQKIGVMPAGGTLKQEATGISLLQSGDPGALLAKRQELKLTDGQAAELEAIAEEADGKALAVLTGDQKETLKSLSGASAPMPQAHPR